MNSFIVFSSLCAIALASPGYIVPAVIPYSYPPLAIPLSYDGKVLDTPEVARAKAEHLATQAYEAARNTLGFAYVPTLSHVYTPSISHGAPLGPDGRVVDTPEVAHAKIAHLAAHAQERAKIVGLPYGALAYSLSPYAYAYTHSAPLDQEGKVVDTPEVAQAKADHLARHAEEAARNSGH